MIRNAFTILIALFLSVVALVIFFIYHLIFINIFASTFHIGTFRPHWITGFMSVIELYGWPALLSIIALVVGVYLKFRLKAKYKFRYFFIVLLCVDIIFTIFAWFYFPHYNLRGYQACTNLEANKQVPSDAFIQRFGKPDRVYPGRLEYIDLSRGSAESCVLNIDDFGRIFSKDMSVTLY